MSQNAVVRARIDERIKAEASIVLEAMGLLAFDQPLDERYRDHALSGNWAGHRDCHLRPDLVLIYQKPDEETLRLVRLGSHSELGL